MKNVFTRNWVARREQAARDRQRATFSLDAYPRVVDGDTVWACCESDVGPVCEHRETPHANPMIRAAIDSGEWCEDA